MKNKKEVIKHSSAIQISNKVNLLQRQTFNVLLANAFNDLDKQDQFKISMKDLCAVLNYESHNDKHLKQLLRNLVDIKVEWNVLNKDGENEWGVAALLAEARIINGVIIYGYAPELRRKFHNPLMYAKISLSLQNRFQSKHSLALYELFVDYFNVKNGCGETPFLSVENFRKLLGLKKNEYKTFNVLNRDIIKKALKEINDKSDLFVNVEYKKQCRKVTALKFCIKRNFKNKLDIEIVEKIAKSDQLRLPAPEFKIDNQPLFETLTADFGISNNKALEILKAKDELYIQEVLNTVREEIDAGKVKNIPAFTVKALENDYRRKKNKTDLEKAEKQKVKEQEQEKARQEQEIINKLKAEFNEQRDAEIKKLLQKMSDDEKGLLIIGKGSSVVKRSYHKRGLESEGVQAFLRKYIADNKLSEEYISFEAYAGKKGYSIVKKAGKGRISPETS